MLPLPPLYPITDATRPEALSAQVRRLGEAGFPLVQFRGKPLDAKAQWTELRAALADAAANGGWPFICVNDRTDLAMLAAREGLAPWGLHLGQEDLPASEAIGLPGLGACHVGASTHAPAEWEAVDPACDHAGVGPFRGTATKSDHAAPIGLEGLRAGCAALRARHLAPVAIGGLGLADAAPCFEAGAEALAMVGEVHQSTDPATLGWEVQRQRWRVRPPFRPGQGIVLLGGSGAGKSTLGRILAQRLGLPFHDLDDRIEADQGVPVSVIFAERGEAAFRTLETSHLSPLLATPAVVALGGGAWEAPANRDLVAVAGFSPLWLAEPPVRAWGRVGHDPRRPLAQGRSAFMARCAARAAAWSLAPTLLPFGRGPEDLVSALVAAW
ncbi:shikimate kinase [Geothrix oryzisoli]|uniref:shikimate kinase n=1 Tax=Geothrix oryzisoli TaxID=2922721 RepID=UPI001FAB8795|nr:shikimate kinase [Geothrix oryzisoli]